MKGSIDEYNVAVDKGNEAWKTWREVCIWSTFYVSVGVSHYLIS